MSGSWETDPTGRHQFRWWDGTDWTSAVSDNGVQSTDPLTPIGGATTAVGSSGTSSRNGRGIWVLAGLIVLAGAGIGIALALSGGDDGDDDSVATSDDDGSDDNSDASDTSDDDGSDDTTDSSDDDGGSDDNGGDDGDLVSSRGVDGELVEDDDGQWSIVVNEDWDESTVQIGERSWVTGGGSTQFQDSLNILVEDFNGLSIEFDEYVDISLDNIPTALPDAAVVEDERFTADDGTEIAVVVYEATNPSGLELRFVGVIAFADDHAATATWASEADRYDDEVDGVRPYMESLRPE